jgi:polysaccharide biosynthesis PFTS motif protein
MNNKKKIIRSFFNICRNNKIYVLYSIKKKIEKKKIKLNYYNKKEFQFNLDKSYSQFLYNMLIYNNKILNIKLISSLASNKTFFFYLPKDWLIEISKSGVKVNFIISKILWIIVSVKQFLSFYTKVLFTLFFYLFNSSTKKKIYFDEPSFYIPKKKEKTFFPDFITFLSSVINKPVEEIENKYLFTYRYENLIKNFCIFNKINFFMSLNFFFFQILFLAIFKNINLFYFSKEIFLFKFLKNKKKLLPEYAFHSNSNLIYRPIWTYIKNNDFENKIYLFFYSDNFITINSRNKFNNLDIIHGVKMHTWQKIIFWNKYQFFWFKKFTKRKITYLISPYNYIPYESRNIILKRNKKKTLSIFDVHPPNLYGYSILADPKNIYTFSYCKKFIADLVSLQNKYDFNIIIKSKLRVTTFNELSFKYFKYLQSLESNKIKIYDKNFSAMSIVKISDAVVSIPFSSPALLAHLEKKKACYYDPKSIVLDRLYKEKKIKLISGKQNLDYWIYKNLIE